GAHAAELRDRAVGHREIGNPDVVVTIDDRRPGSGEAIAGERRAGILRAIRPQQGDAAVSAFLLGHGPYHVIRGRLDPLELHACPMSIRWAMPSSLSPNRLVTHTLPWLSMLRPLLTMPVLKFSALLGSAAGKRVTLSLAFETQIRSC